MQINFKIKAIFSILISLALLAIFGFGSPVRLVNPQVVQGSSSTFTATSTLAPSFGNGWQILNPAGSDVGSSQNARGWSLTYTPASNSLTVGAPLVATVAAGYTAKFLNTPQSTTPRSALFDVAAGVSNTPPATPGGFQAMGSDGAVSLSWSPSANATGYFLKRAYYAGGPYTTLSSTVTGTTYPDTGLTNNLPYYYKVSAFNTYGYSADSAELVGTPKNGTAHFEVSRIDESRTHNVKITLAVVNAAAFTTTSSNTSGGITYTTDTNISYFVGTDNALNDAIFVPQGVTASLLTVTDLWAGGNPSFTANCLVVTGSNMNVQFGTGSLGGTARPLLIMYSSSTTYHYVGGTKVTDTAGTSYSLVQREDYNILRQNSSPISLDSRTTYGQPNLDGELPGDPNAEKRNPSFLGWTYKGGLFVGNSAPGSGDLSGTARFEVFLDNLPPLTEPIWSAFSTIYNGTVANFDGSVNISLALPANSDPNIGSTAANTTWANRWDLSASQPRSECLIDSTSVIGEYACFQNPGLAARMIICLKNEQSMLNSGYNLWRYFADSDYANASGLISATDAQPRVWIVDRLLKEHS